MLVRYAVRNHGDHAYYVNTPQVYELTGARYPRSLYGLVDSQLGDQEIDATHEQAETPVPVLESTCSLRILRPGMNPSAS